MLWGNPTAKIEKLAQKQKAEGICKYLKNKDKNVRLAAIKALGECSDETAYNSLTTLMMADDVDERVAAIEALGKLGKDQSFSLMSHYVGQETNPRVKKAMQDAMNTIGAHQKHGV